MNKLGVGGSVPPWVPDVTPPNALSAPRGEWLRQMEANAQQAQAQAQQQMQAGSSLSLPSGIGIARAHSDAGAYGRRRGDQSAWGAGAACTFDTVGSSTGPRRVSETFLSVQLTESIFGGDGDVGDSGASTPLSSCDSYASTPRVSVVDEDMYDSDSSRLDQILQGLELNVAPTMQVSAINFIDEAVLNLPTREFAQYLKSVDAQTATAIKAARRRKKNREYAKGSRERRKDRVPEVSPGNSPRCSGVRHDGVTLPAAPGPMDAFAGFDGYERKPDV
eukprot:m.75439 g.75439  ORF g.75439 m.75439 type:complete len:277 (-) comp18958_c0_seq1:421-1251(-)